MNEYRCFNCALCGGHFTTDEPAIDDTRGDEPGGSACDKCAAILMPLVDSGQIGEHISASGEIIRDAFERAGRPLGCNA